MASRVFLHLPGPLAAPLSGEGCRWAPKLRSQGVGLRKAAAEMEDCWDVGEKYRMVFNGKESMMHFH